MGRTREGRGWRWARLAALTATLLVLARLLGPHDCQIGSGPDAVWPGAAVLLGLLIGPARDRRDMAVILAAGAICIIACNLWLGMPGLVAASLAFSDCGTSAAAALLLRARGRQARLFDRTSGVLALVGACAAAALLPAGLVTAEAGMGMAMGAEPWRACLIVYGQTLLSLLIVTPMIAILGRMVERRNWRRIAERNPAEIMLLLGLVGGVTSFVFMVDKLTLLFLVGPAVLLATFRLRAIGAVAAVAIVALIAAYATAIGQGPIARMVATASDQMLLLQLFLACCFLSALPISAILAERDANAAEARALAERFRAVVENIGEVIFQIDRRGRWAYLNPAWEALSGRTVAASLGDPWLDQVDAPDRAGVEAVVTSVLAGAAPAMRHVLRFHTPDGTRWVELFIETLRDGDGEIAGATGTLRDIDERKRLEDDAAVARRNAEQRAREAARLASTDELTGIANRRAFMRRLDREIARAAEFGWPLAVAIFDVDHFKRVNDRHGHAVGDRVLQQIAARAAAAVRNGDLVSRLGGEEFAVLMPGADAAEAAIVAERLRQAIVASGPAGAELPTVTVSIGIAGREDQHTAGVLLAAADAALYTAKNEGRNRVRIAA